MAELALLLGGVLVVGCIKEVAVLRQVLQQIPLEAMVVLVEQIMLVQQPLL
jgi:hypothetical protein